VEAEVAAIASGINAQLNIFALHTQFASHVKARQNMRRQHWVFQQFALPNLASKKPLSQALLMCRNTQTVISSFLASCVLGWPFASDSIIASLVLWIVVDQRLTCKDGLC
jgi:hypothetical protein